MCSKRMASARDRAPKVTTTVISTTEAAGCDVTTRLILGRWSEASTWVRSPIWARTRSVVQPTVCLSGREPASISTITWANFLGNAVACPALLWFALPCPAAPWPAVLWTGASDGAVGRGGPARAGAWWLTCWLGQGGRARHRARGAVGLAVVWRPACGNRDEAQFGGGGRLGGSALAGGGRRLGRGALAGGGWRIGRGALAGGGRRVGREGRRRHVRSSRSGECERPRTPLAAAFASGSGWIRLYLRPPTFRRPAWLRSFHGLDERRFPVRRISV